MEEHPMGIRELAVSLVPLRLKPSLTRSTARRFFRRGQLAVSLVPLRLKPSLTRSTARRLFRDGQAFVEMAIGMLALALVLSALFGFTSYILKSLDIQRDLRAEVGVSALNAGGGDESYCSKISHGSVETEPLAATYIFGSTEVKVREEVHIPAMAGLDQ